jgi:hypothetical protein
LGNAFGEHNPLISCIRAQDQFQFRLNSTLKN